MTTRSSPAATRSRRRSMFWWARGLPIDSSVASATPIADWHPAHQRRRVEAEAVPAGIADHRQPTPVGEGADAAVERGADRVQDEVDALAAGEPAGLVGEVAVAVVDAVVEPVLGEPGQLLVASRRWRGRWPRPAWRAGSRPARRRSIPAWTRTVSPACSRPNSNRQSSAVPNGIGTQAADTGRGRRAPATSPRPGTATSSAWEPYGIVHTTRWPTSRRRTAAPTSTIVPPHW